MPSHETTPLGAEPGRINDGVAYGVSGRAPGTVLRLAGTRLGRDDSGRRCGVMPTLEGGDSGGRLGRPAKPPG